jgi:hypothetical protein
LEKTEDVSYSACGMPYNIADADREIDDLVVRTADVFRNKQGIDLYTGYPVDSIDIKNKRVSGTVRRSGQPFQFLYDRLLIATGGRPIIPGSARIRSARCGGVEKPCRWRRIKDYIQANKVKKAVILGMGYVGLEMAEALRERGIEVEMVKPGPDLLPWMPRELAAVVKKELDANQVGLHLGCTARDRKIRRPSPRGLRRPDTGGRYGAGRRGHRTEQRAGGQCRNRNGGRQGHCVNRKLQTSEKRSMRRVIVRTPITWSRAKRRGFRWRCAPTGPDGPSRTMFAANRWNWMAWPERLFSRSSVSKWPVPDSLWKNPTASDSCRWTSRFKHDPAPMPTPGQKRFGSI